MLERLLQVGHVRERHCVRPHPQPYTLNPTPSILHPQPCTLNPRPSTLNPTTSRPRHLAQPQRLIQTNCILRRRFPFIQQHTIGIQFSEVHAMDHSTVSPVWWAWALLPPPKSCQHTAQQACQLDLERLVQVERVREAHCVRPHHLAPPQRLIQINRILLRRFPLIQQQTINEYSNKYIWPGFMGSGEGSYVRRKYFCIAQLQARE